MLNFMQTVYPDWTVEEIAKELAHDYEIVQNANKDPEVHIEKDALFFCFASKIKEWAESKLRYGTLKTVYTTNIPDIADANNPCTHCPNNKGPGTICHCTLGSPKIIC